MVFGGPLQCRNSTAPSTLSFTTAAVSSILMLITVPGNLLICVAVCKDPCKSLRTPFNLFLLNISVADLVVGVGVLPLSIVYHTMEGLGSFSVALIKILHLLFFISCSASVVGIAVLSLDRYICVTSPLKYRSRLTSSRVKKISLVVWLISTVGPSAYLYIDFIIYTFVFANSTILFTLIVLVFVHHMISCSLRSQRKLLHSLTDSDKMKIRLIKRDEKVTKTFLVFLCSFVVLTLPPLCFSYVLNFSTTCSCNTFHVIRDFQFISILFPSSVNPFIYALRMVNFRKTIRVLSFKMAQKFVSVPPTWDSYSSDNFPGELKQEPDSEANGCIINQTNQKPNTASNPLLADTLNSSLDVENAAKETLVGNDSLDCNVKQTIKEEQLGISHFYRVTTNL